MNVQVDQVILEAYISLLVNLGNLETFLLGIQTDLSQEVEATLEVGTLLSLETLEDPMEIPQVVVMEDLVGLEEEGVRMLVTLALITTSHRVVVHGSTLLQLWAGKGRLGLDPIQPQGLRRTVEHPIQLVEVLTILENRHNHHMGLGEIRGTRLTDLTVIIQEANFQVDNQEET